MLIQYCVSYILTGSALVLIALFSFLAKPPTKLNRVFAYYSMAIAWWCLFSVPAILTHDSEVAVLWCRTFIVGAILIPTFFFHFVINFLYADKQHSLHNRVLPALYGITIIFLIANFTDQFISSAEPKQSLRNYSEPAFLFHLHVIYFLVVSFFGVLLLFRRMYQSKNMVSRRDYVHLKYLCWTSLLGYVGGLPNYAMVYDIEIPIVNPFGTYLVGVYGAAMAYLILRYRFLDIQLIIKKTTVFLGLFAVLYGIFGIINILGQRFIENILGWSTWIAVMPSFAMFIIAFRPLEKLLAKTTDKFLSQQEIDNRLLLMQFMDDVSDELDINNIVSSTEFTLVERFRVEKIYFCLVDIKSDSYKSMGTRKELVLKPQTPIIQEAKKSSEPIYLHTNHMSGDLSEQMKHLKIEVVLPLIRKDKFLGTILMGQKTSEREYKKEDLDAFKHAANAIAKAIVSTQKMQDEAEAKAETMVEGIADGASHQYNNKFQTISGPVETRNMEHELLTEGMDESSLEEQNELLKKECKKFYDRNESVLGHCKDGGEIAESILILTRPERRKKTFKMCDIQKCMPNGINFFRMYFSRNPDKIKGLEITHTIENGIPQTYASLAVMTDTIGTGLHNSHDSIDKKQMHEKDLVGKIHLTCSYKSESNIIRFTIEDNGIGIKKGNMRHIGTKGFTTKGTAHQKAGYGMGVFMMKQFVKIHNGKLTFESEEGKGATCIIDIPVWLQKDEKRRNDDKSSISG